jgi:hypothetical protein
MPLSSSVFPALSYPSLKVSGLILRSLIHFELIFVQGERHGSTVSFLHTDIQFSQQHLWKRTSFFIVCFGHLCQKSGGCSCIDSYPSFLLIQLLQMRKITIVFPSLAYFTSHNNLQQVPSIFLQMT